MKEKHYFAGNNTAKGFYSCFAYVFNPFELNHLYILKGGPGVGKSSFMKKLIAIMQEKNYSVEYIHCSSDNDSLDGIIIPELNIGFVDGTAPHTLDPIMPGAVDEIINLGEFLDNNQLEKHKHQIIQINQNKSHLYKSAYRYLHAAGIISEEINSLYDQFIDQNKFNTMCNRAIEKLFKDYFDLNKTAKTKRLFSEAYTADGYISHTKSLCENKRVWAIIGENTNYTSELLKKIADEAVKKGYDTELYCMPLTPDKLQHVFIPEMNLIVISSESYVINGFEEVFDIHGIMDTDNLRTHISEIENNLHLFDLLIKNALEKLSETKKYHELLEVFYINSMNFNGVDECFENILNKYK
ncbi:MAG: hypothetical protein AB7V48_00170 [Sedimentibacter sp.]